MTEAAAPHAKPTNRKPSQERRDSGRFARVFIAAPMSGFGNDEDYRQSRAAIVTLIEHLKQRHGAESVYYAGSEIGSQAEFSGSQLALERDIVALEAADFFVLVYPHKVLSSVLVEAGYAMAKRIPMLLLVRDKADLPYLFKEAERLAGTALLPPLEIRQNKDPADLRPDLDAGLEALRSRRR